MRKLTRLTLLCTLLPLFSLPVIAQDSLDVSKTTAIYDYWDLNMDVAVSGSYAYVAERTAGIRIIDISTPASPTDEGYLRLPGETVSVETDGSTLYAGGSAGELYIIDLSTPSSPTLSASYSDWSSNEEIIDLVLDGSTLYVMNKYTLKILDVTTPASPSEVGSYGASQAVNAGDVDDDIAALVSNADIEFVDLSTPSTPVQVGSFTRPEYPVDVAIDGTVFYELEKSNGGLNIFDISFPATPDSITHFDHGNGAAEVSTNHSGQVYVVADDTLHILNVNDPLVPVRDGWFKLTYAKGATVVGTTAYLFGRSGESAYPFYNLPFTVVDISDPTSPSEVGNLVQEGLARKVEISGSYAYLAAGDAYANSGTDGIKILDISDPENPTEVGAANTTGRAISLAVDDNNDLLFIADEFQDLRVFDISNKASPSEVGSFSGTSWADDVVYPGSGDYIYAAGGYDLYIVDVSTPSSPSQAGYYDAAGQSESLFMVGDSIVYLGEQNTGLEILDVSDPANIVLLGSASGSIAGNVRDLWVEDDYAYIATRNNQFYILDVSDPASVSRIGSYSLTEYSDGIHKSGDFVFLTSREAGFYVFYVGDPTNPLMTGYYDTQGIANDVFVTGDYAYVADMIELGVYDVSAATPAAFAPEAFSLSLPTDGAVIDNQLLVQFFWDSANDPDATGTQTYDVWMGNQPDLSDVTEVASDVPNVTVQVSPLMDDTDYYWTVFADDDNTIGTWASDTLSFSTAVPDPPDAFTRISPADESVLHEDTVTVIWSSTTDPDPGDLVFYRVEYDTDPNFGSYMSIETADTTADLADLSSDEVDAPRPVKQGITPKDALPDEVTIYWRVRAFDQDDLATFADDPDTVWSFTLDLYDAPEGFSLTTPEDESVSTVDTVLLGWEMTTDPDPYDEPLFSVYVDTLPDLSTAEMVADSLEEDSLVLKDLMDDYTYFWTVKASDSNTPGMWANDTNSFSIHIPEAPAEFSLLSPLDGAKLLTDDDFPFTFRWLEAVDPDPGDTVRYVLEISEDEAFGSFLNFEADDADSVVVAMIDPGDYFWRVFAFDTQEHELYSTEVYSLEVAAPDAVDELFSGIPAEYSIAGTYPNPFNPTVTAVVGLPDAAGLTVEVYNLLGQRIAELASGQFKAGYHRFLWDGSRSASGLYLIRATVPGKLEEVKRVMLLK